MITLVMVFGLLCNTSLWAGNGAGAGDGSMLDVDLGDTILIEGVVYDAGISGSGLIVDEGAGDFTTVYGMGSLSFWEAIPGGKPVVGDFISIDAVSVDFSDGSTRLIAVSLTVDGTFVTLRTDDGPVWRTAPGTGDGTGICPLAE